MKNLTFSKVGEGGGGQMKNVGDLHFWNSILIIIGKHENVFFKFPQKQIINGIYFLKGEREGGREEGDLHF